MRDQRFLPLYDYGAGGVWLFVIAESREEVTRLFPELVVVDNPPEWMSEDLLNEIEEKMTFRVSRPTGVLAALIAQREKG